MRQLLNDKSDMIIIHDVQSLFTHYDIATLSMQRRRVTGSFQELLALGNC
jgi:hypothetical protein